MSRSRKVRIQFPVERDGKEVVLSIDGRYAPGVEGQTWGPPENCFPPEPAEAEIEMVWHGGYPWRGSLTSEETEAAIEALIATGDEEGPDGPDPDDAYDSRFDREDDDG